MQFECIVLQIVHDIVFLYCYMPIARYALLNIVFHQLSAVHCVSS